MSIHYQVLLIIFSKVLHNYKCIDCKSCLEYISTENRLLIFKCSKCNKNHNKKFNKDFIKGFVIYNRETRRASEQALNHGFILKKMYRVIPFHQKAWLKLYLDMNIK